MAEHKKEDYGSRFLYSENLLSGGKYHSPTLTISAYHPPGSLISADKKPIMKPTIGFDGRDKMLVLCKTNVSILIAVTGEQPGEKWIGKSCRLEVRIVDAFGEQVTALRVMPPQGCMIRKALLARLGSKAEWVPPADGK